VFAGEQPPLDHDRYLKTTPRPWWWCPPSTAAPTAFRAKASGRWPCWPMEGPRASDAAIPCSRKMRDTAAPARGARKRMSLPACGGCCGD